MRDEQEIREALAREVMHSASMPSKETVAARAAFERIRTLEWVLETTELLPPRPGNGAPEAE